MKRSDRFVKYLPLILTLTNSVLCIVRDWLK